MGWSCLLGRCSPLVLKTASLSKVLKTVSNVDQDTSSQKQKGGGGNDIKWIL